MMIDRTVLISVESSNTVAEFHNQNQNSKSAYFLMLADFLTRKQL